MTLTTILSGVPAKKDDRRFSKKHRHVSRVFPGPDLPWERVGLIMHREQNPLKALPKKCDYSTSHPSTRALDCGRSAGPFSGVGRGRGVTLGVTVGVGLNVGEAAGVAVGVGLIVGVGVTVGVAVGVTGGVGVSVGVGVAVAVGVGVAVGVAVGVGVPPGTRNAYT